MLKTLQQQERNAMRLRARPGGETGPKDDADWEWEALVAAYRQQHGWVGGGAGRCWGSHAVMLLRSSSG